MSEESTLPDRESELSMFNFRWVSFVCLVSGIVGCAAKTDPAPVAKLEPEKTAPDTKTTLTQPKTSKPVELPAVPKLNAKEIVVEFDKNFDAAIKKYKGKIVEMSGEVDHISRSDSDIIVALYGQKLVGLDTVEKVRCKIPAREFLSNAKLRSLSKGQSVTLRGKLEEKRDVWLADCEALMTGESTIVGTTLSEIESELASKKDMGRFKDRDVLVRVTIEKPGTSHVHSRIRFVAKKNNDLRHIFHIDATDLDEEYTKNLQSLKAGESVLFLGEINPKFDDLWIEIVNARVLNAVPEGVKLPEVK